MTKTPRNPVWSREEHILAFNLYCQIPFGTIHIHNPKIIELAGLLGRSVGAVSYKLANFSARDPALQQRGIKGMAHGAKGEELIWEQFAHAPGELAMEAQRLLAERLHKPLEEVAEIETADLPRAGIEREALIRIRVNQSFFRRRVLSAYDFRCCVTGLANQQMLVASHIIPWAMDAPNRLNPRNGLCLNALHDRAFDRKLMWIDERGLVRFAERLRRDDLDLGGDARWITRFEGRALILPEKFSPDPVLLEAHARGCGGR